jgi:HTH-type transcriptional regulator / antitoxin HigA
MDHSRQLFDLRPVHPGRILRRMMDEKGWEPVELSAITGISGQMVYNLLSGKSNVSPKTAARLAQAFGNTLEEWLKWDGIYRASLLEEDLSSIGKLARLYEIAPVRDMQKRGWIELTADAGKLEEELTKFYGSNPLEGDISLHIAAKRTLVLPNLSPAEKAWCFRARQLAATVVVDAFDSARLGAAERKLRQLAAYPKEARHLPKVLAEYGIRFVVVEPLPGAKIDGAAFWIDSDPVIAVSIRHDRIDGFWFTVMHEFAHIKNGDAFSADTDLIDSTRGIAISLVEDEAERLANEQASTLLVPADELNSFIRRVGPHYPKERVIQFANKVKIHPGIIVGQLQHRNEVGYSALRDMLVKVRDVVTSTALTDGWNHFVTPTLS